MNRLTNRALTAALLLATGVGTSGQACGQVTVPVTATLETAGTPCNGADDSAIWVHPIDPGLSLIFGQDKICGGLFAYDLAGDEIQSVPAGLLNNIDVRYDFPLGSGLVDIVAGSNRTDNSIDIFSIDPHTGHMQDVAAGALTVGVNPAYGFTLYHSCMTGAFYAIVNDQAGNVEQYELIDDGLGRIDAVLVRSLAVGTQTEGMVADDQHGLLYIGEEDVGIWRYGAEPRDGSDRVAVDLVGPTGNIGADVEGLTIYYTGDGGGYLVASSQGRSEFVIYDRAGHNEVIMRFAIVDGASTDGCSATDGIDVTSVALSDMLPAGLFVAHDDDNTGGNQNYKLVNWREIAEAGAVGLLVDTTWDPRHCGPVCLWDLVAPIGGVDELDVLVVLEAWGTDPGGPPDFDGDGTVGVVDFLLSLRNFGPCP
jgi:3-phytase